MTTPTLHDLARSGSLDALQRSVDAAECDDEYLHLREGRTPLAAAIEEGRPAHALLLLKAQPEVAAIQVAPDVAFLAFITQRDVPWERAKASSPAFREAVRRGLLQLSHGDFKGDALQSEEHLRASLWRRQEYVSLRRELCAALRETPEVWTPLNPQDGFAPAWLPLHLMAACFTAFDTPQNGAAPVSEDEDAFSADVALSLLTQLAAAHPSAVDCDGGGGSRPLHIAARCCPPMHAAAVARLLLSLCPDAAQQQASDGRFPLHLAAARSDGAPQLVSQLLDSYQGASMCADEAGWLPLHYGARYASGPDAVEVARLLVEAYADGPHATTPDGSTPMHLAIKNSGAGRRLISFLIDKEAGSSTCADVGGWLPLHWLAQYGSGPHAGDVARTLLAAQPESARITTKDGRLPLHLAATNVQAGHLLAPVLLETHPAGIGHADANGWLPLHFAAHYAAGPHAGELIEQLITANPESLHVTVVSLASAMFPERRMRPFEFPAELFLRYNFDFSIDRDLLAAIQPYAGPCCHDILFKSRI